MNIATPDAPATKKQLWLLHILTKTDTRDSKLTMQQASDKINEIKNNGNGNRPLVNPHATAIKQDRQKLAQAKYDKANPKPEREVIQGDNPAGETDIAKVNAHFMANAYQQGREFAGNDTAKIDIYDFQCKGCLFGKTGICQPDWCRAGYVTCKQVVESVSFNCRNCEPVKYSIFEYCHRPHGKQCHRKTIDNRCLECSYRSKKFRDGHNHSAWGSYIPTIQERIKHWQFYLEQFTERPNAEGLDQVNNVMALLNKLS